MASSLLGSSAVECPDAYLSLAGFEVTIIGRFWVTAEVKEVKKHSFYVKPGEKKRLKQALARKRSRKKIRREPFEDRK
jgi:hypothetical protein